jgi:small-conductance mechanosensitive channel
MARLPQKRGNVLFRFLSRAAGVLALVLIMVGFIMDAADTEARVEPITVLFMGIYVLGAQIYFLLEYFVETGGIE